MAHATAHFFVAGFQRCGSTWLARVLDEHPEIALAKPLRPEPKVFLDSASGSLDPHAYRERWFGDAPSSAWCLGEKSVSYSERADVPDRIRAVFPDARVVMVLRDPVQRALSNWRFSTENGAETLSFPLAIAQEEERCASFVPGRYATCPWAYIRRGLYWDLLAPWRKVFGASRMHVAVFENLLRPDSGALVEIFDFLGVARDFQTKLQDSRINASEPDTANAVLDAKTRAELARLFAAPNQMLSDGLGLDLSAWSHPS